MFNAITKALSPELVAAVYPLVDPSLIKPLAVASSQHSKSTFATLGKRERDVSQPEKPIKFSRQKL